MTTAKKQQKPAEGSEDARRKELADLLYEHAVIADRIDALEEMKGLRRDRILLLMRELGISRFEGDAGTAAFQSRRSFKVRSPEILAKLMSPLQLAGLANITADVYDAATAENMPLDEAIIVGQTEQLSVSRARTKAERDRRKAHIDESRRQAEQRIAALREQYSKG